eukprot:TRINITY_DN2903_c0_g2_i1.p1 TRINITY_DN2903_c0_g2~~TRINITY_DN2903_c0_g2_i1.p1  ORF type:complete len:255 (-),score=44.02 TRINITY_DN2903_c0_g2_i1:22-786(-)
MTAEPFPQGLVEDMELSETLNKENPNFKDLLIDKYQWDVNEAKKIWCFGPESSGPNMLIDMTKGVEYINEIKDSCVAAFQWVTKEGVLCEENCRGIRWNINDVTLHTDAIHRGGGQIIPAARRCFYGCVLTASPRLMEPVYLVEIQAHEVSVNGIYNYLHKNRGYVISEEQRPGTHLCHVKAYLPVVESFGFAAGIRSQIGEISFLQCVFDHWHTIAGDPMDPNSKAASALLATRKRKGLAYSIPSLGQYLDNL